MALKKTGIKIELREVKLSDMPTEALALSPEETVPILQLTDGSVFTESWDIVKWALQQNDPDQWLGSNDEHMLEAEMLIETNDFSFKDDLDHYKYSDRFPEFSQQHYRESCEEFIVELEERLEENNFLLSDQITLADIGVFPFVRQFSLVDKEWFYSAEYPNVQRWLNGLIESELFQKVFQKHELWTTGDRQTYI